jgi:heme/copper-type cytochrome/quinol oxidase subunit 2
MTNDTISYDSSEARPLPKWLTDQRDGLNAYQPEIKVMKEDHSLQISVISTGVAILLAVVVLTLFFIRKNKKRKEI